MPTCDGSAHLQLLSITPALALTCAVIAAMESVVDRPVAPKPPAAPPSRALLYRWSSTTGSFRFEQVSPCVFRTEAIGVATGDAMDGFIEALDRLVALGHRGMLFFHDWSEMESYEPSMRSKLTNWRRSAPKGTTESIHILLRSSLVTLGVSASSIALRLVGIELYTYTERLAFERKLTSTSARFR